MNKTETTDKKLQEMNDEEIREFRKEAKKIMIRPRNARANAM
ncbi:MAG: hypothetical protein AABW86_02765 [Candidatus Micrarchaeota archaeon]